MLCRIETPTQHACRLPSATSPACAAHHQSALASFICAFPCRHARSLSIYREGLEAFHKAYPFLVGPGGLANGWQTAGVAAAWQHPLNTCLLGRSKAECGGQGRAGQSLECGK